MCCSFEAIFVRKEVKKFLGAIAFIDLFHVGMHLGYALRITTIIVLGAQ